MKIFKGRVEPRILHSSLVLLSFLAINRSTYAVSSTIQAPSLNPPRIEKEATTQPVTKEVAKSAATEWTYHKSNDGAHPDGKEQQMLWLMNRARANPAQEGEWLATESDPDVAGGRDYFEVVLTMLRNEFTAIPVKPPAAFDIRLYNAALAHSLDLIARDAQDHLGQFARVDAAEFHYLQARGNVFAYADSSLNAHAAFNIDWGGDDGSGMQTGRGHRMAIMSIDGDYTNVGLAAVADTNPGNSVGPFVVTGNFAKAATSFSDHYNVFIVGTVWRDSNHNGNYDPGEGVGGVTVMPDSGTYFAVTGNSGGYTLPISSGTSCNVTFSGGLLNKSEVKSISINQQSVLLDFIVPAATGTTQSNFPWPMFLPAMTKER